MIWSHPNQRITPASYTLRKAIAWARPKGRDSMQNSREKLSDLSLEIKGESRHCRWWLSSKGKEKSKSILFKIFCNIEILEQVTTHAHTGILMLTYVNVIIQTDNKISLKMHVDLHTCIHAYTQTQPWCRSIIYSQNPYKHVKLGWIVTYIKITRKKHMYIVKCSKSRTSSK